MNKYEAMYVITPELEDEAIKGIIEKYTGIITANGGEIEKVDEWGRRRLAYPINDLNEGHYVLMTFTSSPELPAELDRVYKITEGVMRSLIIAHEE